jgi:hypothetical protein
VDPKYPRNSPKLASRRPFPFFLSFYIFRGSISPFKSVIYEGPGAIFAALHAEISARCAVFFGPGAVSAADDAVFSAVLSHPY